MRAVEFIRDMLDLIEKVEAQQNTQSSQDYADEVQSTEDNPNDTQYSNSPDERVTSEKVIFSMGNDLNKPKHPSDLRANSFSMYPNMQYDPRKQ